MLTHAGNMAAISSTRTKVIRRLFEVDPSSESSDVIDNSDADPDYCAEDTEEDESNVSVA